MEIILRIFPVHLQDILRRRLLNKWTSLEEIRLRLQQPVELVFQNKLEWLDQTLFREADSLYVLNQLSEHSLYRMEKELQEGYITIKGGHRIGLAGKVTLKNDNDAQLQRITFYNIRIAKQIIGVAAPILPYLYNQQKIIQNTLIIGPPKTGKTTIIRDLARLISTGDDPYRPAKVGIIDERSEIAAAIEGVPQHQVGKRTDVMDACPKVTGMMMMIRSMSPEVLVIDEIGREADVHAIMEAILSGVAIISTIHGQSLPMLLKRPSVKMLLNNNVFSRIMTLSSLDNQTVQVDIMNAEGTEMSTHLIIKQ